MFPHMRRAAGPKGGKRIPASFAEFAALYGYNKDSSTHSFVSSVGGSWTYNTTLCDAVRFTVDEECVMYGVGGGGLLNGSMTARIAVYRTSDSVKLHESDHVYTTDNFFTFEFNRTEPLILLPGTYQVEHWPLSQQNATTLYCSKKDTGAMVSQGVTVDQIAHGGTFFSGKGDNGTDHHRGQIFWMWFKATSTF